MHSHTHSFTGVIEKPDPKNRQEHLLSSKEWLKRHGLKRLRLTAQHVLAANAFRHADGVVDVKSKPSHQNQGNTDSVRTTVVTRGRYLLILKRVL